MDIIHIIAIIAFIFGFVVKKSKKCPAKLYLFVNQSIILFCLPSISLLKIPSLEFNGQMIHLVITAWLIFFAGIPFFYLLSKIFKWKKETLVCLIVVCGLGNTAFIGLPIIGSLFGEINWLGSEKSFKICLSISSSGHSIFCIEVNHHDEVGYLNK